MIRILCLVASMDAGGAETFLMKLYRCVDRRKVCFAFCVCSSNRGFYDDEIENTGGRIFRITPKTKSIIRFTKELSSVIKENDFDCVMRIGASSIVALDLWIAKLCGVHCLIFRSSNAGTTVKGVHNLCNKILRVPLTSVATVKIAPSHLAAEYTFGKNNADKRTIYLKNGLDIEKFQFDPEIRKAVRREFCISDNELLVGHIGRFNSQKNHKFLLEVFNEILKRKENAKLMLVGKGELCEEINEQASKLGILNKVIFTGVRSDVNHIMMGMDILFFPSLYEGMPNVILEAQTTGLRCVISDTITTEVMITDRVRRESLKKAPADWVHNIFDFEEKENRSIYADLVRKNGYDIRNVTKTFVEILERNCRYDR